MEGRFFYLSSPVCIKENKSVGILHNKKIRQRPPLVPFDNDMPEFFL